LHVDHTVLQSQLEEGHEVGVDLGVTESLPFWAFPLPPAVAYALRHAVEDADADQLAYVVLGPELQELIDDGGDEPVRPQPPREVLQTLHALGSHLEGPVL